MVKEKRKKKRKKKDTEEWRLKLRPVEQLLLDIAEEVEGETVLAGSTGIGHGPARVAERLPESTVHLNVLDVFLADSSNDRWQHLENFKCTCEPDWPEIDADAVMLALPTRGESELARDLLQTARQRLRETGKLYAATDNPKDHWLHEQLKSMFGKVTNRGEAAGRIYVASKPIPLKKVKSFEAWFAYRDEDRLVHVMSRPGTFSHRRLDLGARALIDSLVVQDGDEPGRVIQPGDRVLDIGCGTGSVGLAAAQHAADVHVHFLDANARAIQCAKKGAERNELASFSIQLEANGECNEPGTFDLALANPPYFSNFRIADIMIHAAQTGLKPGGRVHFVTKQPAWFADRFVTEFEDVSVRQVRSYFVVKGIMPRPNN
jgi:16S rRNA (guanine1207-N2)-methyltransferase